MSENGITQKLMDEVYSKWNTEECRSMDRLEVIENFFTPLHRAAVQLGNMNYQVNNGGWSQWHLNGYSEDMEDLIEIAKKGTAQGIKHFDILLQILTDIEALGDPKDYNDTEICTDECYYCGGTGYVTNNNDTEEECDNCNGTGREEYEEEIDGEDEYRKLLGEFDDKYYDFNEDELIASFDEFISRFDETVNTAGIKTTTSVKPRCKLVGTDSNVFSVIGKVRESLRKAGLKEQAEEFSQRAMRQKRYEDVLSLCFEYVDVC